MASKNPDPEDEKAMAEKAKQAKAAASEKVIVNNAPKMSGGLISEAALVDPVAEGAGKMAEHIDGVKPDGTYMTPEERIAAHRAAKDTRFTMPNEPAVERGIVPQGERGLVPYQPSVGGGGGTPPPASPSGGVAGPGAPKPSLFNRAVKQLTPSPSTLGLVGANLADYFIPRADDSTDTGYNINTARETAMSALNAGSIVPMLGVRDPRVIGGAALLGGGMALYNRLKDYNAQHPENDAAPLQLPNASPNFWSQAPAAIHDAGHLASQALRGLGDGINYDIEHYTPYPYVRDAIQGGAQKAVDYFTPPKTTKFEGGAKILREATQGPVSEMNPDDLHEVVNSQVKLPPNVKQEDDGSYTKSIYDDRGNYIGYGNSRTPYAAEAEKVLKQDLGPQAQAIYERLKAGHAQNSSSKPPVMKVSPSGEVIQTNYDEDGNIVRSQNPEVQRLVDERLRDRAQQAVAAMPEFEAGHVERFNKFKESVEAERALETAKNTGVSQDPIVNARTARIMVDSAERLGKATGKDPLTLIPAADPRFSNPVEDIAREILQRKAQNLGGMSQSEAVANALLLAPNQYRSPIQEESQKNAIQAFAPAQAVVNAEATKQYRDSTRDAQEAALKLRTENAQDRRGKAEATASTNLIKGLTRRLDTVDKDIAKYTEDLGDFSKKAGAAKNLVALNKKKAAIQADLDKAQGLEPEEVDSESSADDNTPQPNPSAPKVSSKEEYDKLPKGSQYIDPNGRTLTKK